MQTRKSFTVLAAAVGALVGTLVLAAAAAATAPERESFEFSFSRDFPAGTICDFNYHEEVTGSGWDESFFDEAGNYVRDTLHLTLAVTHTNSDTGYTLTEVDTGLQTFVDATQQVKVVGIQWLLKDSTGRIVLAHAGQLIFDFSVDDVTKVTPNFGGDFAEDMCPALGGNPA
jgi:hypothetical protein